MHHPRARLSYRTLLLAVFAILLPVGIWAQAAPEVSVAELVFDFGEVGRGKSVSHEFVIENRGDAPLEIRDIRAPCACTVVKPIDVIPPNSKASLHVELDTTTLVGPASRQIYVFTNDPNNPRVTLTLEVESTPWVNAAPGYVRYIIVQGFDDTKNDSTLKQTLYARENADFEVVSVESEIPFIEASFHEAAPQERNPDILGQQWIVETRIRPDAEVGPITGHINVKLSHPEQPALAIPASGFVRPVFAMTPTKASFGDVVFEPDAEMRGSIQIRNFATEPIAVTDTEVDVPGITAAIEAKEEGRIYFLHLLLDPSMPKGPFAGKVKVLTDSPRKPVIEIPISGTVR